MGVFSNKQTERAKQVYNDMKEYLQPKNGQTHVVMVNSYSKLINNFFGCDDKYTLQLEYIISSMQHDGYEIVDVKFNSLHNQGIMAGQEGFHTLILYR